MAQPQTQSNIDLDNMVKRIFEAIIKRLEGGDDPRAKYDYLAKLDKDTLQTLAVLSDSQLDSTAECCFMGNTFPSMAPLKVFVEGLAHWSPSKQGKRADLITSAMINQETHVVPTTLALPSQSNEKKKKEKKEEGEK